MVKDEGWCDKRGQGQGEMEAGNLLCQISEQKKKKNKNDQPISLSDSKQLPATTHQLVRE